MSSLQVNFVAADRNLWNGEATYVAVPTVDGSLGILPRMAPVLAVLAKGPVRIVADGGTEESIQVSGGFVSVDESVVTIVADDVEDAASGQSKDAA